jgi:hypothetical protein
MSLTDLEARDLQWRKARRSAGNGACVEVAPAAGNILIRDSKDQDGPILSCSADTFRWFLEAAKSGALLS